MYEPWTRNPGDVRITFMMNIIMGFKFLEWATGSLLTLQNQEQPGFGLLLLQTCSPEDRRTCTPRTA